MNKKALAMLSGGLDSTLAIKVALDQGVEVEAVNFTSPFCQCNRKDSGCGHEAKRVSDDFGIPLHIRGVGNDYIEMIQHPKYGYGKNMNPCQDCRIFMLKKARELMKQIGASFLITGEVLGQRPMSQHRIAFRRIERDTGLEGLILRPLCAKALEPSLPELEGVVDREMLLDIVGRSRKPQIELAATLGVSDYPCPAGGCLLTDHDFSLKLRDAFAHGESTIKELRMLRMGRHLRLPSGAKVVIGRDQSENERLLAFFDDGSIMLSPLEIAGPSLLLRNSGDPADLELAAAICLGYTKTNDVTAVKIEHKVEGEIQERVISIAPLKRQQIIEYSLTKG